MVGVAPTQTILPGSRPHESAAVGGLPRFAPDQPKNAGAQQGRVEAASAPAPTARDMCGLETCAGPRQMRAPGMCGTGETCAGGAAARRGRRGGSRHMRRGMCAGMRTCHMRICMPAPVCMPAHASWACGDRRAGAPEGLRRRRSPQISRLELDAPRGTCARARDGRTTACRRHK